MAGNMLSARELEILNAFVSECSSANVDWAKVAEKANCSTLKYARDKFALIKNKLVTLYENGGGDTNGTADDGTPKKAVKKTPASKRKKSDANEGEVEETPTKKKKATTRKPKSATPGETKDAASNKAKSATPAAEPKATPAAVENGDGEANGDGDVPVKTEPNEAGELMNEMASGA